MLRLGRDSCAALFFTFSSFYLFLSASLFVFRVIPYPYSVSFFLSLLFLFWERYLGYKSILLLSPPRTRGTTTAHIHIHMHTDVILSPESLCSPRFSSMNISSVSSLFLCGVCRVQPVSQGTRTASGHSRGDPASRRSFD